jgi:hypothetical protein
MVSGREQDLQENEDGKSNMKKLRKDFRVSLGGIGRSLITWSR